tara:strand:+ start:3907 stop:4410 length:504 start_codon:yes stop_codon:yes gene_type:complete
MIFTAPKIIAGIISTIWAFTTFLGVASSLPDPSHMYDDEIVFTQSVPPTIVASTTTITTIATCDDALQLALDLGFPADQLATLELVMYRESRCQTTAHNKSDPNGGSYGLTQINGFWCLPNSNWPIGWLQEKGLVEECSDLHNATIALRSTLAIYNNSGWAPWETAR